MATSKTNKKTAKTKNSVSKPAAKKKNVAAAKTNQKSSAGKSSTKNKQTTRPKKNNAKTILGKAKETLTEVVSSVVLGAAAGAVEGATSVSVGLIKGDKNKKSGAGTSTKKDKPATGRKSGRKKTENTK